MKNLPFAPNAGYVLSELKVDQNAVTIASSYTFTNVVSNHTITATFSPVSYTIKYNGNGATSGTMSNPSHTYGVAKALTANSFSKTGYNFIGWSTSSSATTATYMNGQSVSNLTATNGVTVNLYAVWRETLTLTSPTGSPVNTDEISVSITGTLGSGSGDIVYKLYVGGTYKSTVTGASGTKVTLNATGLTANTTYSCYVVATSKVNSLVTATSSPVSVKTYACMGDTYQCTSFPTDVCATCSGWGTTGDIYNSGVSTHCSVCWTSETLRVCPCGAYGYFENCGTWYKTGTTDAAGKVISGHKTDYSIGGYCSLCPDCNGAVYLRNLITGETLIRCPHGQAETHKYCSHGKIEPHY